MIIRPYHQEDAEEISSLVRRNLLEVNIRDYPAEDMEQMAAGYDGDKIRGVADSGHLYVALDQGKIIGSGAITPLDGSEAESLLQTVFILPEYQGQGVGRALLQALEADHYFLRARRVVANASITARPFYEKMGYAYPSGRPVLIDNDYYEMEKLKAEGQA